MGKLEGKVAIITGCSEGLGKQIAKRFVAEGAKVAICARNITKLEATAKECEALGGEVFYQKTDLCEKDQMESFVKGAVDRFGTIDILVNNAISICPPHSFLDHTEDELRLTMTSGFLATWRMMLLCFPYLKGKNSSIVNFGSTGGEMGMDGFAAYASAKEAILTRISPRQSSSWQAMTAAGSPARTSMSRAAEIFIRKHQTLFWAGACAPVLLLLRSSRRFL
jgi:NAD(P)-dependent dehydrogenase (short-subunit alcohol dehydrogenase family)